MSDEDDMSLISSSTTEDMGFKLIESQSLPSYGERAAQRLITSAASRHSFIYLAQTQFFFDIKPYFVYDTLLQQLINLTKKSVTKQSRANGCFEVPTVLWGVRFKSDAVSGEIQDQDRRN
jgi:hypothetical protein